MVITAHIINNSEISLTECELMLAELPERTDEGSWTSGPFPISGKGTADVAVWDNEDTPAHAVICQTCWTNYNA